MGRLPDKEDLPVGTISSPGCQARAKRASLAVAHSILVIAYQLLKHKTPYQEPGGESIMAVCQNGG
jgi:hypothetical protein